jgi:hypothetical protein
MRKRDFELTEETFLKSCENLARWASSKFGATLGREDAYQEARTLLFEAIFEDGKGEDWLDEVAATFLHNRLLRLCENKKRQENAEAEYLDRHDRTSTNDAVFNLCVSEVKAALSPRAARMVELTLDPSPEILHLLLVEQARLYFVTGTRRFGKRTAVPSGVWERYFGVSRFTVLRLRAEIREAICALYE